MSSQITDLLVSWCDGDADALDALAPLVESELHRLAHSFMRKERSGHLLETTALVNEAYIRLLRQDRVRWQNRAHFFGIAGQMMRRILSNYARDQRRLRRGGGATHVSLSKATPITDEQLDELIYMDEALDKLAARDKKEAAAGRKESRMVEMIQLRYYFGFSVQETAEALGVSPAKVNRDCKFARAWVRREVGLHLSDAIDE